MSQYSNFGDANPLTPEIVDPVEQCVGNTFFTKSGIPGGYMQKDFCPRFMAQRCATKWDDYCEAYLIGSNYDMGGNLNLNKDFLEETARKKYCRLNTEAPGAQCAKKCEALIPEGQNSVSICENVGTQNWMDTKKEFDLAGNFPQSAKLTPVSPLYMDRCPEICDAKDVTSTDALGPNDIVLNKCIEHGACDNILADLGYNVVKNGTPVSNPAFQKLIEYSKLNVPLNVNNAIKIAKSYGIPASVALEVLKTAKYGSKDLGNPVLVSGDKGSVLEATPEQLQQSQKAQQQLKNVIPVDMKENFYYKLADTVESAQEQPVLRSDIKEPPAPTPTASDKGDKGYMMTCVIKIVLVVLIVLLLIDCLKK